MDSGATDVGTSDALAPDTRGSDAAADVTESPDGEKKLRARDFTLNARGMTAHAGRPLVAWVVEEGGQQVIGRASITAMSGPDVELRLPSLVPIGGYHTDVYVDANMNGTYDGPATDPSWRLQIPENGSASVSVSSMDPVVDIAMPPRVARRDLTVHLEGLQTDEFGRRFELRVLDPGSLATLAGHVQPMLPANASLDFTLPGVVDPGGEYSVDFWIDADGDGVYGGAQRDHSWHGTVITGADGGTFSWTRVGTYDALDWR